MLFIIDMQSLSIIEHLPPGEAAERSKDMKKTGMGQNRRHRLATAATSTAPIERRLTQQGTRLHRASKLQLREAISAELRSSTFNFKHCKWTLVGMSCGPGGK